MMEALTLDKRFEISLGFLNTTYQAATKIINSSTADRLESNDVKLLKELQEKIKAFNIERATHEFTLEDKVAIIASVKEIAQTIYSKAHQIQEK